MDEQNKNKQHDQATQASERFMESLRGAGYRESVVMVGERNEDGSYEVWSRVNGSTFAIANMLIFTLNHMDDESTSRIIGFLLSQPSIQAKMAAYQSQMLAKQAEFLRSQQPAQDLPADQTKKEWMN